VAVASRHAEGNPQAPDEGPETSSGGDEGRQLERFLRPLRFLVGLLVFALVVLSLVRGWDDVRTTLSRIAPYELALSEMLVLVGLGASVLTWRVALRELGALVGVRAASKIYLLGQLGKYLPGSVWALAAQMELARNAGVPRMKGFAASVVAIGVNVVTGLAIGLLVVPSVVTGGAWRTIVLVVLLGACAAALSPPVLTRLVDFGLRLVRRPAVERAISWQGILAASGWSVVSWVSYGTSVWVLAVAVGAPAGESLPLCLGGMALAMTVGFLVVVAPSGIGVREAVIVASLSPVLDRSEALAVALLARLVFTVADLVAAAVVVPVRVRASGAT
jgi:hypothetical protein